MHDLLGNVKSLKLYYDETNTEWCFHITFSHQGEWLTTNGDTPIKEFFNKTLQRDAEGRLTALRHEVEGTCEIEDDTYTYNDQGLLATARFADDMGTNTETYTYDTDGNLTQMVSHSMDDVASLATRLVGMSRGQLVATGTPREIFRQREMMERIGLGVPEAAQLCGKLRDRGLPLPEDLYTPEELRDALLALWKEAPQA